MFVVRTVMQPLMLIFVFTYVFPKIGQGVGGESGSVAFTNTLVAGVVALAIVFQGIQAVALPLVQEFGYSKEIEDRVLAPLPDQLVGVQKIVSGATQGLVAACLVFPIALFVPATNFEPTIDWLVLVTLAPLGGMGVGLARPRIGTASRHRTSRTCGRWSSCRSRSSAPSTTRGAPSMPFRGCR